jgi:transposase
VIFLRNKVSIITDNKFIPIDVQIFKGNVNDSKILQQQMKIIIENKDYVNYLFADNGKK